MKFTVAVLLVIANTCFADSCNYVDVYWRDYNGTVPEDAVKTGHNIYIAQVTGSTAVNYPGTLYPDKRIAIAEVKGKKAVFEIPFKIMCTKEQRRLRWEHVNIANMTGTYLDKCVMGGYANKSNLYIGKVFHEGEWKISKIYPFGHKYQGLGIWKNSGGSVKFMDFHVLVFD